jgi:hypothetical protein
LLQIAKSVSMLIASLLLSQQNELKERTMRWRQKAHLSKEAMHARWNTWLHDRSTCRSSDVQHRIRILRMGMCTPAISEPSRELVMLEQHRHGFMDDDEDGQLWTWAKGIEENTMSKNVRIVIHALPALLRERALDRWHNPRSCLHAHVMPRQRLPIHRG